MSLRGVEPAEQARAAALALRDRHWPVITAASELLYHNGTSPVANSTHCSTMAHTQPGHRPGR